MALRLIAPVLSIRERDRMPFPGNQPTDVEQYDLLSGNTPGREFGSVVGDLWFLVSAGPFDLPAGASAVVAGAILFGRAPDGTTTLAVDPITFRPDPNDPILADLFDTRGEIRDFYDQTLRGTGLPKRGDAATTVASAVLPERFALYQNHPNPFNPTTEIRFELPEAVHVRLVVYDVMGREVARLVDGAMPAGQHRATWDALGLPSGLYLYRLTAGPFSQTKAMTLLK